MATGVLLKCKWSTFGGNFILFICVFDPYMWTILWVNWKYKTSTSFVYMLLNCWQVSQSVKDGTQIISFRQCWMSRKGEYCITGSIVSVFFPIRGYLCIKVLLILLLLLLLFSVSFLELLCVRLGLLRFLQATGPSCTEQQQRTEGLYVRYYAYRYCIWSSCPGAILLILFYRDEIIDFVFSCMIARMY